MLEAAVSAFWHKGHQTAPTSWMTVCFITLELKEPFCSCWGKQRKGVCD